MFWLLEENLVKNWSYNSKNEMNLYNNQKQRFSNFAFTKARSLFNKQIWKKEENVPQVEQKLVW